MRGEILGGGGPQFVDNLLKPVFRQGYFMENAEGSLWRDTFIVLLAWGYEETCHVEGSRADEELTAALGIVAVGTVLPTREDH